MNRKRRFHISKPQIQLFDATGMGEDTRRSLTLVIVAVAFGMVFTNITTGPAWTGFQRMLKADSMMLGIISAIPVMASTFQIVASYVLERWRARRGLFLAFGLFSRLLWCVIGLIPFIIPEQMAHVRIYALMVLLALTAGSGSFINVGFYSLVGDLVPLRVRGRYFSSRQMVSLLTGILAGLFVSFLMDRVSGFIGYTIVLVIAGVFGAIDIACYFFVKWPPMHPHEGKHEGLPSMLRGVLKNGEYMRIVGYFTLWFFAVNIAGPFTNVYFLEEVRMTYTEITLITQILPNITTVLIIRWWGRQMDQYGMQPVVQLAGLYCMLMPLTYLFTGPRSFAILPATYILSGIAWPASDLGQQNMYLAKAPEHNRSMYVAVFFASTQMLGTAMSNFVGGYLMSGPLRALEGLGWQMMGGPMSRYDFIFIISGVLRILCVLGLLPRLREETESSALAMVRDTAGRTRKQVSLSMHGVRASRLRKRLRKEIKKEREENQSEN